MTSTTVDVSAGTERVPTTGDTVLFNGHRGVVFHDPGYRGIDGRWWLWVNMTCEFTHVTWKWTLDRDECKVIDATL